MTTPITLQLRPLRLEAGLSQQELGRRANVRQATISTLETRTPELLDLAVVARLAKALRVHPSKLFGWDLAPESTALAVLNLLHQAHALAGAEAPTDTPTPKAKPRRRRKAR